MKASDLTGRTKLPRRPHATHGPRIWKPCTKLSPHQIITKLDPYLYVKCFYHSHKCSCLFLRSWLSLWLIDNKMLFHKQCSSMSWKKLNFMSVSCSWYTILLVIQKHSTCAWAFYHWAVAWHVNGNTAADSYTFQKCSALGYGSMDLALIYSTLL